MNFPPDSGSLAHPAKSSEAGSQFNGGSDATAQPPDDLPEPRSPRYETLTLWRGLACLFVVIFHSVCTGYGLAFPDGPGSLAPVLAVVKRLWIGVPLFFVISGYCVTASADAARRRPNSGLKFFRRRFRRIYPPYWAWFAIAALLIWVTERFSPGFFGEVYIPNPRALTPGQWFGNLTLTESWRWHLTGGVENALLSPSWTLCYEEQFYALVGLVLLIARRYFFSALALVTGLVLVSVLVLPGLGFSTMGLFLDGKWFMFAAGVLAYYAINYAPQRTIIWFSLPLGCALLWSLAKPDLLLLPRVNEPNQSYFSAFIFAWLLILLHGWDSILAQARLLRPLAFCGEMCYSLYLIHWPVVTLVSWAFSHLGLRNPWVIFLLGLFCCLSAAIAIARLFYRLVERRFWNTGYAPKPRPVAT